MVTLVRRGLRLRIVKFLHEFAASAEPTPEAVCRATSASSSNAAATTQLR